MKNDKRASKETVLVDTDREAALQTLDKVCQSMAVLARTVDRLKFQLESRQDQQKNIPSESSVASRLH